VRRVGAGVLALGLGLLPACTSGVVTDGDAVAACRDRLPAGDRDGLRMTVTAQGEAAWVVKLWTDTPKDVGSPTGTANIVCTASARDGSVVIDAFARTRQDRDVSPEQLCRQLLPALDVVTADMSSGVDAGPDLITVRATLPDPLPTRPERLAAALDQLSAEVAPAARAAEAGPMGINAGDFSDWPGLVARVQRACRTPS
jgi:hypothetical protein